MHTPDFPVQFQAQYLLYLLPITISLTVSFYLLNLKIRRSARQAFGDESLLNKLSMPIESEAFRLALWVVSTSLILVAAARPVAMSAPSSAKAGSLEVVAVIDVSKSMASEPYRDSMPPLNGVEPHAVLGSYGSCIDAVSLVIRRHLLPQISGNQFGLVTFKGSGFPQAELTSDFIALSWVLEHWVRVGAAPGQGSDYAKGLKEALSIFDGSSTADRSRVIILFSDGGFTGDDAHLEEVIAEIKKRQIKLFVIGVGSTTPVKVPEYDAHGIQSGNLRINGETIKVSLDEASLEQLAFRAGGEYHRLGNDIELNLAWPRAEAHTLSHTEQIPLYQPLCLAAVLLILMLKSIGASRPAMPLLLRRWCDRRGWKLVPIARKSRKPE